MTVRLYQPLSSGNSTLNDVKIPQLNSDPVAPTAESAWVLKVAVANPISHSLLFYGLTMNSTGGVNYFLKYRTLEGTTVSVALT